MRRQILTAIRDRLVNIYGGDASEEIFRKLLPVLDRYRNDQTIKSKRDKYRSRPVLTEKDSILITYADSIVRRGEKPLRTLLAFLKSHVGRAISGIHILPFFPYSSDDGFSIIDYRKVKPELGGWAEIRKIADDYRLMLDLVLNHVSSMSGWFQGFLKGDARYRDYFICFDRPVDTSSVFRPRVNPLLTRFKTSEGVKYVWTTFSKDQIDLNYRNPNVLIEMLDIMLFYLSNGAEIIRLDAVGFLWKELGTPCFNLRKTHEIVRLIHEIIISTAPYALIITESNTTYNKNISFFGEGEQADMVYQFSLPPLVVDAFFRADNAHLKKLCKMVGAMKREDLFFDILASHDGIGILGAKNFLKKNEILELMKSVKNHHGLISYKSTRKYKRIPYELNISFFDAINDPGDDINLQVRKFLASQAILMANKGIPGIYIHSLIGSQSDLETATKTGIKREINRQKLSYTDLENELASSDSVRHKVLKGYLRLLNTRCGIPAMNPYSAQEVVDSDKRILILRRYTEGEDATVLINLSNERVRDERYRGRDDALSGRPFGGTLEPYGVYFLTH